VPSASPEEANAGLSNLWRQNFLMEMTLIRGQRRADEMQTMVFDRQLVELGQMGSDCAVLLLSLLLI
jgi:hypothetical protein